MVKDLTYGSPAKVILFYSVPIIIGNLFQQIYNLVDMVIVGRFLGFQALAGVGATSGLNFLVLGFALGITSGLGIMTAQFYGAKDYLFTSAIFFPFLYVLFIYRNALLG